MHFSDFWSGASTCAFKNARISSSSSSFSNNINFVEAAPTYHVYSIKVNIDTREVENYNAVEIKNVPVSRLSLVSDTELKIDLPGRQGREVIVQKVPGTTKGSVKAYVASGKELNSDEILDLSARALRYKGQQVSYDGRRSRLPICKGLLTGFVYRSSKRTGSKEKVEMLVNISEPGQGLCLIKAEVVAPSKGAFSLTVDGNKLVKPRMGEEKRAKQIHSWEAQNSKAKRQDRFSLTAFGLDRVLRSL